MKLIDLLVKELPRRGGWPEAANYVVQDYDGTVKFSKSINFLHIKSGEWCSNKDGDDWIYGDRPFEGNFHHYTIAQDRNSSIVTREQYESALAASDGWIEWNGGDCPVDSDAIVEVRFSSGELGSGVARADSYIWRHEIDDANIVAYRPHRDLNSNSNDDRLEQDLNVCIGQGVDVPEWNGDGLPPVGTICMANLANGWTDVKVAYIGDEGGCREALVFEIKSTKPAWADEFRPLRTEAEMARDKLAASLHISAGASPIELNGIGNLYFKLADAIISGSVFGTTFKAGK